ncbi:MAG: hypothetical protein K6G65_03765 [Lachnospiraceae bacterium]|nr:hypothetical protein [Lachnospiraceae bacterium]
MAIDTTNYFKYLDSMAIHTSSVNNNTAAEKIATTATEESNTSFETALLSMIEQSRGAYEVVSQKAEQGELETTDETISAAKELYDDLSSVISAYNKMELNPLAANSVENTLFQLLNQSIMTSTKQPTDYADISSTLMSSAASMMQKNLTSSNTDAINSEADAIVKEVMMSL